MEKPARDDVSSPSAPFAEPAFAFATARPGGVTTSPVVSGRDRPTGRLAALDHLRGFVIVLVVLHHAVLAYCTFGYTDRWHYALSTAPIVDPQRWVGFDGLVRLNDAFFMPLLFLLSGLFVWGGLSRKGAWPYLRARLIRLGLPFVTAVLTVVPLAYYPSFRQAGGPPGFVLFWAATVTRGPWPSGPPWFIAVLLLFDAAAAGAFALFGRQRSRQPTRPCTPVRCFCILLAGSLLAYLPLLAAAGPTRWVGLGPLAIQESRIGLYAAYFVAGVVFGARGLQTAPAFATGRAMATAWSGWASLAILTGMVLIGVDVLRFHAVWVTPAWLSHLIAGAALATFCVAACFALTAVFLRFGGRRATPWASLATNGYGIYLLHYPAVTWVQYGLLHVAAGAASKAAITFATALTASWTGAILLRRLPGRTAWAGLGGREA